MYHVENCHTDYALILTAIEGEYYAVVFDSLLLYNFVCEIFYILGKSKSTINFNSFIVFPCYWLTGKVFFEVMKTII